MRAGSRAMRIAPLLLLTIVASLLLSSCTFFDPARRDDRRMREILRADYPGFRIVELKYENQEPYDFTFDGSRLARYLFTLESEHVPGFMLFGQHNLFDARGAQPWGPFGSMFDGKSLRQAELIELERLWVRAFPSALVQIGDDSFTGPVTERTIHLTQDKIAPQYSGIPLKEVYCLSGDRDERPGWRPGSYFRLDPESGKWSNLRGFLRPGWE